jgi:hypothetical protein
VTELPESLVSVVQALANDAELALWFESLADVPFAARSSELRNTAARIGDAGPFADLAYAMSLIAAPGVYEAVLNALHELRAEM